VESTTRPMSAADRHQQHTFSNNWVRNCAEPFTRGADRPVHGECGGISLPVENNDYIKT